MDAALTEADARYLELVWEDAATSLGPDTELLALRPTLSNEGVTLVARYRLGEQERESSVQGETIYAAHERLRARILFDRLRFGFTDYVDRP